VFFPFIKCYFGHADDCPQTRSRSCWSWTILERVTRPWQYALWHPNVCEFIPFK